MVSVDSAPTRTIDFGEIELPAVRGNVDPAASHGSPACPHHGTLRVFILLHWTYKDVMAQLRALSNGRWLEMGPVLCARTFIREAYEAIREAGEAICAAIEGRIVRTARQQSH